MSLPICAVCHRKVEELREEARCDGIVFTAYCHGKTESVSLTAAETAQPLRFVEAFQGEARERGAQRGA